MSRQGEEPDTSYPRSLVDADEYQCRNTSALDVLNPILLRSSTPGALPIYFWGVDNR